MRGTSATRILLLAVAVFASTVAPWSFAATRIVTTEHVQVVFDGPALEPLARRVAAVAETALARVTELFGAEPFLVTFTLTDATDVFNALAVPAPRPTVALRTVPPLEETIGLDATSWLELLIIHELAHLAHFTQTKAPAFPLGLIGEGVALPPPLWVVEGVATWVESELTTGGRRDDARTAGLLATLALSDAWPSLAEASTATVAGWPGGETQYLIGAAFLEHLSRVYGWDAIVGTIEAFNVAPITRSFADVWADTAGGDLYAEWDAWRSQIARDARVRRRAVAEPLERVTDSGWYTGLPVLSPTGDRIAWRTWPPAIAVATVARGAAGEFVLGEPETFREGTHVESLDWLDAGTLVFTRTHRTTDDSHAEAYSLDLTTGREQRLTTGARAHFVRADVEAGCIRYVRAAPAAPAAVVRTCTVARDDDARTTSEVMWQARAGAEIVGLDVSATGQMVVSVWDRGDVGLAVLEPEPADLPAAGTRGGGRDQPGRLRPRFLTWDGFQDLEPVWTPDGDIRFRSDRTDRFEIYEIDPGVVPAGATTVALTQLTDTVGGAFQAGREHVVVVLGAEGFDLAWLPDEPGSERLPGRDAIARVEPRGPAHTSRVPAPLAAPATDYSPWPSLAPLGWLPTDAAFTVDPLRVGLGLSIYGQDASVTHAYALNVGFDTRLEGVLGPAYAFLHYEHQPAAGFASFFDTPSRTLSVEAGVWPHAPHLSAATETALGARVGATFRWRADRYAAAAEMRVGMVHLGSRGGVLPDVRLDAALATAGVDRWGYPAAGVRVVAGGRWTPTASGASAGAWAGGSLRTAVLGGSVAATVRAGYRQRPPFPVALHPEAVTLGVEGRWRVPVAWRYGDGRYALERLTVTPAVRAWGDVGGVGIGADVALGADLLINYAAPVTLTARAGWAQGFWYTLGLGIAY